MKIKVQTVLCKHETKYGIDSYIRFVKKNENVDMLMSLLALVHT